jgi:hypothetical protein
MSCRVVDAEPLWRSHSGRTELHTEPGGVRVHGYGMTTHQLTSSDLLNADDIARLHAALTPTRTHQLAAAAADAVTFGEPIPLFAEVTPLTRQMRCRDCGLTVQDPLPWWDPATGQTRFIGPGCYRKRRDRRLPGGDRVQQLALYPERPVWPQDHATDVTYHATNGDC